MALVDLWAADKSGWTAGVSWKKQFYGKSKHFLDTMHRLVNGHNNTNKAFQPKNNSVGFGWNIQLQRNLCEITLVIGVETGLAKEF